MFRSYGVISLIILGAFIFINFYRKDVGFQPDLPPEEDPHEMAEEGTALAPHGVPANPIPRALSSQKLNEGAPDSGYGTYNATNGMLDIPGGGGAPTNPFLQGSGDGGSGGGGYNYSTSQPTQPLFSETNPFRNYLTNPTPFPRKDSPINSPDLSPDYESIKHRFQVSSYSAIMKQICTIENKPFFIEIVYFFSAKCCNLSKSLGVMCMVVNLPKSVILCLFHLCAVM